MAFCNHCSEENFNDAKFCGACGEPMEGMTKPIEDNLILNNKDTVYNAGNDNNSIENNDDNSERFLGIDMTPENKQKAQKGLYAILVILGIVIVWNIFGASVSEKQAYQDAIDVLDYEFAQEEDLGLHYSNRELADIEKQERGIYVVTGNVYDNYDQSSPFEVKLVYNRKNLDSYEWNVGTN